MAMAPLGELKLYNYHEYSLSTKMIIILTNVLFTLFFKIIFYYFFLFTLLKASTSMENIYDFRIELYIK